MSLKKLILECLPDLEHYVSTHGPGPDKRLDALKAELKKLNCEPVPLPIDVNKRKATYSTPRECSAFSNVRIWVLLYDEMPAGTVRAHWSKGGTCNVALRAFCGPLHGETLINEDKDAGDPKRYGSSYKWWAKASGYGYCKFSHALNEILRNAGYTGEAFDGRGETAAQSALESLGYSVIHAV